jgi:hypothetical protein
MQDAISNVATYLDTQSPLDTEAGIALKDSQAIETHGPGFMIRRLQQVSVSFFHYFNYFPRFCTWKVITFCV